jgi:putative membrane protein
VASVPSLRRALTPRGARRRAAERAAQQAFASLGIEKTRERTGVLVFVALFERTVVLLPDRGIPETLGRGALASLEELLSTAVERRDLAAFLSALAKLGPACGAVLPRRADDENELCDDVA